MKENGASKTVLFVTPYFPPYGGGLEQYAKSVAERLQENHDWRVVVITSGDRSNNDTRRLENGVIVHRLGYQFKISNTPFSFRWFARVQRIIREESPYIVNVHTPVPGIGDIAALVCGKRSLVVTYHASSMKKGRLFADILVWLYEHGPMRSMLDRAQHIICSSDAVRLDFLREYQYKSTTITPGVDGERFKPDPAGRATDLTLLFVAALGKAEHYKGLGILIDALPALRKKYPRLTLHVVGDGDMRTEYERSVAVRGLEGCVVFKGRLLGAELVRAYQEAHVFVLPTSHDSSPLVITEALACALPVISTKVGGIPSIIEDGKDGFLIEPHDPMMLAATLDNLLADPARSESLGVAGRKKALQQFNWQERAKKYDCVLRENAQRKPCIVQVSGYYPPHLGGVEQVAKKLAELLVMRGSRVIVLTSDSGSYAGTTKETNLTVKRLRSFECAHTPVAPTLLMHLFGLPHESVIHLHLSQAYWPELVLLVAKLRSIPYIVHFHLDVRPSGFFGSLFLIYKKILWGPLLRHARRVIVLSTGQAALVREKYKVPGSNITILPNGVDEVFFSPRTSGNGDRFELISVGRLSPQKRLERLIEALPLLTTPVHLTLVGEGEERQKLEALSAALDPSCISFVGYKKQAEVRKLLARSDALLISSEHEGMPLSVLEAMAAGLPIIGSNVPGIRELIEGAGILVDEPYPEGLAGSIDMLAHDTTKQRTLSQMSIETARKYAWPSIIDRLEELYKTIV